MERLIDSVSGSIWSPRGNTVVKMKEDTMAEPWKLLLDVSLKADDKEQMILTLQRIVKNLKEGKTKGEQWENDKCEFEWKLG